MISAAWDWYYGSHDEELLADCEFGDPFSTKHCSNKDICVRPATLGSGMQVTVFTQVKTKPKEITDLERNSNRLKLLRHPNVLRHIHCLVTETDVNLVTERVSPLYLQCQNADANEITSGIYDIAQALKFLHEKAGLTHNALNIETIFVTEGGAWKLSGLENACQFAEATSDYLKGIKRPDEIIPPEEIRNKTSFPIEKKHAHCRDVYALGVLLAKFNKQARFASEVCTQEIEELLDEILQTNFKARPPVTELLDTAVLASEYISIVNFLQSITLKSKPEKTRFFTTFLTRMKKACISDELIAKRIAKLLLSPVILAEGEVVEQIIPRLLTPIPTRPQTPSDGLIPSGMFARYVIPQIVDLLEVKLLHVRLVLVNNFHRYVHMFEKSVLQEIVLPEILLGFHDSNNQLVKASLHALAEAVPIVGGDIIVGDEREKIFSFGMPKFNGSVLVDTTSLAYELKPKRKPKKPKRKKSPQKGPVTLLQLAMSRDRNEPTKNKTQKQRDLMMLKQNELATSLASSSTNGHAIHQSKDFITIHNATANEPKSAIEPASVEIETQHVNPTATKNSAALPKHKVLPKAEKANTELSPVDPQLIKQAPDKVREPEIETWVGSGSEDNMDDDNWGDFENFAVTDKVAMPTDDNSEKTQLIEGSTQKDDHTIPKTTMPLKNKQKSSDNSAAAKPTVTTEGYSPVAAKIIPKPPHDANTEPPVDSAKTNQTHDLGNEFEIAVKVKASPPDPELDFFADMKPDISAKRTPTRPIAQSIPRRHRSSVSSSIATGSGKSSPISVSFKAEDLDNEADGWENEAVAWDD